MGTLSMHTYSRPIHTHTHIRRTDTVGVGGGAQEIERLNKTKPGTQAGIEEEQEEVAEDEEGKVCGKKGKGKGNRGRRTV